jgi:hypothetical protein
MLKNEPFILIGEGTGGSGSLAGDRSRPATPRKEQLWEG